MEQVHGTHKASKLEPGDILSSMPENVVTNILNHLPIKDAVKTDILSKYWRFKYTMITSLVFDENFFTDLPDEYKGKMVKIISRLLLHLKGPIKKFVLYIPSGDDDFIEVEDLNHWLLFLSRNGIEHLTLICSYVDQTLELPTQLYSCRELKYLSLNNFCFYGSPSFHGFPYLRSLRMIAVNFENYTFGEFIAQCPLLKVLINLNARNHRDGQLELVDIPKSKLGNLEFLWWSSLCTMIKSSSIFRLAIIPKLQELQLLFWNCEFVAEPGLNKKVPTVFLCLKTLNLQFVDFSCDIFSSFVFEMICNSPNLQCLKIKATRKSCTHKTRRFIDLDYSKMEPLQLRSVVFKGFKGSENEICFIKFLLACSPGLKRIVIVLEIKEGRYKLAKKLLNLRRAYPVAEIAIC